MSPCATCHWWRQQRFNKHMGHCTAPLPLLAKQRVGLQAFANGFYAWIEEAKGECLRHLERKKPVTVGAKHD